VAISKAVAKRIMKKYRRKPGTTPVSARKISQMLKKGANVPTYMAKDGGYIAKKRKKVVKKRKK
tara:strand:- start:128 stop:319 length:192 start_codon:yes stop_codon:yes gene_type:complete